eukprot:3286636-Pleurochrysis_carterae.AAC.1
MAFGQYYQECRKLAMAAGIVHRHVSELTLSFKKPKMQAEHKSTLPFNWQLRQTCKIFKTGKTDQSSWFLRKNRRCGQNSKTYFSSTSNFVKHAKSKKTGKTDRFSWFSRKHLKVHPACHTSELSLPYF